MSETEINDYLKVKLLNLANKNNELALFLGQDFTVVLVQVNNNYTITVTKSGIEYTHSMSINSYIPQLEFLNALAGILILEIAGNLVQ